MISDDLPPDPVDSGGTEHQVAASADVAGMRFDSADEATLPASGDAIDAIRSEAARIRSQLANDGSLANDPTKVIANRVDDDLAIDPTRVMPVGPTASPPGDDLGADHARVMDHRADPGDPGDAVRESARRSAAPDTVAPAPVRSALDPQNSLTQGKAPPATTISYWDRDALAPEVVNTSRSRAAFPRWFVAAAVFAVVVAIAIVLTIMLLTSGSSS